MLSIKSGSWPGLLCAALRMPSRCGGLKIHREGDGCCRRVDFDLGAAPELCMSYTTERVHVAVDALDVYLGEGRLQLATRGLSADAYKVGHVTADVQQRFGQQCTPCTGI